MNPKLTDITIVLDRSGSMASCRDDAEGGLNTFIEEQKKVPGDALLTLVQFDTEYDFVHRGVPIKDVPKYTLVPRGGTALLDAVGRAIGETGDRLSKMAEADRPGLVIFVILTDGHENSSREFQRTKVKEMIERQAKDYNWQFTYLGANQDAFAEAGSIGILRSATLQYDTKLASNTAVALNINVRGMRLAAAAGEPVLMAYSQQDRDSVI